MFEVLFSITLKNWIDSLKKNSVNVHHVQHQSLCVVLFVCEVMLITQLFLVCSYSLVFVKIYIFFSPDDFWKKQRLLLHAIYLSVISLLVAINIFLVVRGWRKPILKVTKIFLFPQNSHSSTSSFLKINKSKYLKIRICMEGELCQILQQY